MSNYNGWTNYETWRVNLEIFDGLEHREMFDLRLTTGELGRAFKEYAEEVVTMSVRDPEAPSIALDYALAFLSAVNWHQIAECYRSAYAEDDAQ
jgi:hypothetical protein